MKIKYDGTMINSTRIYETPMKQNENKHKQTAYQNNAGRLALLPNHITPPSGLTKFIARNPFENDLTNRLHLPVISPTVFSKVSSPQQSSEFTWSVEELALIQPAKIEEFPIDQIHPEIDPEIELQAQAAIDKFFMANEIIPSPWDSKRKEKKVDIKMDTPKRLTDKSNIAKDSSRTTKKDVTCQTILSLPPKLPPNVEEALKPYFTFNQEANNDSDDANSSTSSLRRKLFFNHNECFEHEEHSSLSISPIKINSSLALPNSPPQSGMLLCGTPLRKLSRKMQRYHGTPIQNSENLSPPNMSPILDVSNTSSESVKARSRSVVRLDFTQNMEMSVLENIKASQDDNVPGVVLLSHNSETYKENINPSINYDKNTRSDISVEMHSVIEDFMPLTEDNKKDQILKDKNKYHNIVNQLKHLPDLCQTYKMENCTSQQMNTFFGLSERQDTGYQTYSMNSTTNIMENSSVKQKLHYGEPILISEDEIQLSDWKGNMKHVVCSTPSKYNNEKD
ncbi:hypothetical protein KPH14_009545 [Odynerus spinipes]|uniref:Protein aurora borealis n=1 Tax=Odynerus spinipes TaxID=1348599 RepID=A0AAD9RPX3_9HYME|nr:hypothetical protein KPH14_009545 [Odynerus spinipes]